MQIFMYPTQIKNIDQIMYIIPESSGLVMTFSVLCADPPSHGRVWGGHHNEAVHREKSETDRVMSYSRLLPPL